MYPRSYLIVLLNNKQIPALKTNRAFERASALFGFFTAPTIAIQGAITNMAVPVAIESLDRLNIYELHFNVCMILKQMRGGCINTASPHHNEPLMITRCQA